MRGLGWDTAIDTSTGPAMVTKGGSVPGFISEIILYPNSDSGVFVSINTNPHGSGHVERRHRVAGGRVGVCRDSDWVQYARVTLVALDGVRIAQQNHSGEPRVRSSFRRRYFRPPKSIPARDTSSFNRRERRAW